MPEVMKRLVSQNLPVVPGTTRLAAGYNLGSYGGSQLYTVPASTVTVVRDVRIMNINPTGSAMAVILFGTSAVDVLYNRLPAPAGTHAATYLDAPVTACVAWLGTLVLQPGESLWGAAVLGAGTIPAAVFIHGVEIS